MSPEQQESSLEVLFSDAIIPELRPESNVQQPDSEKPRKEPTQDEPSAGFRSPEKAQSVSPCVMIVQSDLKSAQTLSGFFAERGDRVWQVTSPAEAHLFLEEHKPGLVVMDLQLSENGWQDVLHQLRQRFPDIRILFTTKYPDPQQELRVREYGAQAILRQPFTRVAVAQALRTLEHAQTFPTDMAFHTSLPKVRVPVRIKITFPYVLLALVFAMAAAYVVSRVVLESAEARFTNQLVEMGKLVADRMVQEENRLLETCRLLANLQEMPQAVVAGDAERLRELAYPIAVNYEQEAVEILDIEGETLLSLRHQRGGDIEDYDSSRGDDTLVHSEFVRSVLKGHADQHGDKYAGLVQTFWGDCFYVVGPVLDAHGDLVGGILVGKSLSTLVRQIRQDTLAHIAVYDFDGQSIVSTFLHEGDLTPLAPEQVSDVLERQDHESIMRGLTVAGTGYGEIVGPWEVRGGDTDLGLIGTSLSHDFLVRTSQLTRYQIFLLVTMAFLLVIAVGVFLADRITRPLLQVVRASGEVAEGNLEVRIEPVGGDEIAVLAHSFNRMVAGLREGSIYRDLLGRTVSPEVREQLRQTFASGHLRLEGQDAIATVLMSDIRSFTTLSERENSTTILTWLNEYFGELVPIITSHGGVVNAFEGDALVAFFGILPRLLPAQESACCACRAALEMLEAIERINARRAKRGEPPFVTGIGVNTGMVTAGGLGAADRLHYTIIGDTVNTTQRLGNLTRRFGESGAVISQHTLSALGQQRHGFFLEPLGAQAFKGKSEQLLVYRLRSSDEVQKGG